MLQPSHYRERRSHSRVLLDLPLDYQAIGSSDAHGAIAIDGSETGLFVRSFRHMPVGTQLKVSVFFADEFELADFNAVAKIVRAIGSANSGKGYGYGLQLLRINEEDMWKFSRLLINNRNELIAGSNGASLTANSNVLSNTQGWQPKKERWYSLGFLLNLPKIR